MARESDRASERATARDQQRRPKAANNIESDGAIAGQSTSRDRANHTKKIGESSGLLARWATGNRLTHGLLRSYVN